MKLRPCTEKLEDMIPAKGGNFCSSCDRVIVDLTEKSQKEIQQLYIESGSSLCGIVKKGQINESRYYHPIKRFAFSILIVFGTSLFTLSANAKQGLEGIRNHISFPINDSISISGNIVNENGDPTNGAKISVFIEDEEYSCASDKRGNYRLKLPKLKEEISLTVEISKDFAYKSVEVSLDHQNNYSLPRIKLSEQDYSMGIIEEASVSPIKMGKFAPNCHGSSDFE